MVRLYVGSVQFDTFDAFVPFTGLAPMIPTVAPAAAASIAFGPPRGAGVVTLPRNAQPWTLPIDGEKSAV